MPSKDAAVNRLLDIECALQLLLVYIGHRLDETELFLLNHPTNRQASYPQNMAGKRKPGAAGEETNKAQTVSPLPNTTSADPY